MGQVVSQDRFMSKWEALGFNPRNPVTTGKFGAMKSAETQIVEGCGPPLRTAFLFNDALVA